VDIEPNWLDRLLGGTKNQTNNIQVDYNGSQYFLMTELIHWLIKAKILAFLLIRRTLQLKKGSKE